jgi:hypothetical protein
MRSLPHGHHRASLEDLLELLLLYPFLCFLILSALLNNEWASDSDLNDHGGIDFRRLLFEPLNKERKDGTYASFS